MTDSTDQPPDPLDEPTPIELPDEVEVKPKQGGGSAILTLAVGTFSAFMLIGLFTPTCAGATNGARLQWQDRQSEIEATIRAAEDAKENPDDAPAQTD